MSHCWSAATAAAAAGAPKTRDHKTKRALGIIWRRRATQKGSRSQACEAALIKLDQKCSLAPSSARSLARPLGRSVYLPLCALSSKLAGRWMDAMRRRSILPQTVSWTNAARATETGRRLAASASSPVRLARETPSANTHTRWPLTPGANNLAPPPPPLANNRRPPECKQIRPGPIALAHTIRLITSTCAAAGRRARCLHRSPAGQK